MREVFYSIDALRRDAMVKYFLVKYIDRENVV